MLAEDVVGFVLANMPQAPARVLEVGAGDGELARLLTSAGYEVVAVDPGATTPDVIPVPLAALEEPAASFDAAVAVLSLHHVDPLEESCVRLASVLRHGATLLVDEFDVDRFDERAATWWLEQRRLLGAEETRAAADIVAVLRSEVHPLSRIRAALEPHFELQGRDVDGYLYRWDLDEALRPPEVQLIAAGELPGLGVRLVGHRL
jgi:SAM-dependent methyltransferase